MTLSLVAPTPPIAQEDLPHIGAGLRFLAHAGLSPHHGRCRRSRAHALGQSGGDRYLRPEHYVRNALPASRTPLGKETVSTFGHGKHACPAQRFSHHMCKIVVTEILDRFTLEPRFTNPEPSARPLGGVARPDQPARIRLRRTHS